MKTIVHSWKQTWLLMGCVVLVQIGAPEGVNAQLDEFPPAGGGVIERKIRVTNSPTQLSNLVEQMSDAREKIYRTMISDERRSVAQVAGLDAARAKELEKPAQAAV